MNLSKQRKLVKLPKFGRCPDCRRFITNASGCSHCESFRRKMEAEAEILRTGRLPKIDPKAPGSALEQLADCDPEAAERLLGY